MPDTPDAKPAVPTPGTQTDQTDPSAPILISGAHDSLDRANAANAQAAQDAAAKPNAGAPPKPRPQPVLAPAGKPMVYDPKTMKVKQPLWQTLVLAFFILLTVVAAVAAAIRWMVINPREAESTADYLAFTSYHEEVKRLLRDEKMRRDIGDYTEAKAYASKAFDVYADAEEAARVFFDKYDPADVEMYTAVETDLAALRATMAELRHWYEIEYPKRVYDDDGGLPNSMLPGDNGTNGDRDPGAGATDE